MAKKAHIVLAHLIDGITVSVYSDGKVAITEVKQGGQILILPSELKRVALALADAATIQPN